MSGPLDDIVEAICGEALGNVVDWFAENASAWVLGFAFFAAAGLTVLLFAAVHWSLGILGAMASVFFGFLWVLKLCFR